MKRSPRQQALRSVYQFVAAALVVLWGLPLVAFLRSPSTSVAMDARQMMAVATAQATAKSDTSTSHAKTCCCANCPGGTHCCCGGTHAPKGGVTISALCDMGVPSVANPTPIKVAFFLATRFASTPSTIAVSGIYPAGDDAAPSHQPAPFLLPPRLS